jgi:hypothetical protein
MIDKSLGKEFFEALVAFFKEAGYEAYPVFNQFRKDRDGGFTNVIFSITHYHNELVIECTFGSRINLVEETLLPYSNFINGCKAESNTAITNLAKFLNKPHFKLMINGTESFNDSVAFVKTFFDESGFQFLQELTEITNVEQHFNHNLKNVSLLAFNHQMRAFRGITLATVAQNPHWEDVRQEYIVLLRKYGTPEVIMDRFERLSNHLAGMSLN